MTFIYVMPLGEDENGVVEHVNGNGIPPADGENAGEQPAEPAKKPNVCSRIFGCCKCCKKKPKEGEETSTAESEMSEAKDKSQMEEEAEKMEKEKTSCFSCCKRKPKEGESPIVEVEPEEKPTGCWERMKCKNCCKKRNKISDTEKPIETGEKTSCWDKFKKKKKPDDENWAERRDPNVPEYHPPCWKRLCCGCRCCRKEPKDRKSSMMSQKKSVTSSTAVPLEDTRPKLDSSLVEYTSHMRGAVPVLPIPIAWICLFLNVVLPGVGTIISGLICLCIGKPRFSPRDSAKARIGAFIINVIVGFSQVFCVLFCLVGWGWSIWWGVIMVKVARKYKKIKKAEEEKKAKEEAEGEDKDVEKG